MPILWMDTSTAGEQNIVQASVERYHIGSL